MNNRVPLSVAIITKDEAENLPRCLGSVAFADQIVVVDSGSSDDTVNIAAACGCDVFVEEWRGFGPQKQMAVDRCRNDWILVLDADECISPETADVIKRIVNHSPEAEGYSFPRKNFFQGRWIRHAGWWPDRVVRLFRRSCAGVTCALVHEAVEVKGKVVALDVAIEHFTDSRLSRILLKINTYSTLGAEAAFAEGKRTSLLSAFVLAKLVFLHNYFFRLGFLDGAPGFMLAVTDAVNKFFKYAKLAELSKGRDVYDGKGRRMDPHKILHKECSIMQSLSPPPRDPYPKQLIIDIHSYCNARCVICPYPQLKTKNPMGIMDEKLFIKIINEFSELSKNNNFKGHCLFCNMGELFLYPKMAADRIAYVIRSGLGFDIQTNAAVLYPDVVDLLKESGFDGTITINCHGISTNVYKQIMGLDISKTLENIDYLLQNYPKEKIVIQSIPYHWPKGEAKRVRSYFREKGLIVRMPLPHNRAGLVSELKAMDKRNLIGCRENRPLGEMVICFNGDVILCCNDMAQQEIVGNLLDDTIEEVWNGETMLNRIGQIYCGASSPDHFICRKCEFGIASALYGPD